MITIPVRLVRANRRDRVVYKVYVKLIVNYRDGEEPTWLNFLLDSGADMVALSPDGILQAGIDTASDSLGEFSVSGVGSVVRRRRIFMIRSLIAANSEGQPFQIEDIPAIEVEIPNSRGVKIHGIIGMDWLTWYSPSGFCLNLENLERPTVVLNDD